MEAFEKLQIWKRSCRLSVELYRALENSKSFGFKEQITRSALSAEGYERDSIKEFIRFLKIAKGSCGELRTQLYIGCEAGLLDRASAVPMIKESEEIARMLKGMIKRCISAKAC